jgi:tRNA(fMet)-specific endonuclease VapC
LKLSLDTNVLIELLRGRKPHYRYRLVEAISTGAELNVSAIVLHELVLGARLSARPTYQMARVQEVISGFEICAWTVDDAIETAGVRARLQMAGSLIGPYDMMIAGQCLSRGWTLVTANLVEFGRIEGLAIINWSNPDGPVDVTEAMRKWGRPPEG